MLTKIARQDTENDDVVALYIQGDIYFGELAVNKAIEVGYVDGFMVRPIFQFMASMDLDPRWNDYANSRTLFTVGELNKFLQDAESKESKNSKDAP